jgi:hypothetical protein
VLDPTNETKFLNWLAEKYTNKFGYGIRNIDNYPFLTTYGVEHLPDWLCSVNDNIKKSHVVHWARELEAKDLVRFSENGYEFYFTKYGYESVQRNGLKKLAVWFNNNPGLISAAALLVALGSILVAIIALYKN